MTKQSTSIVTISDIFGAGKLANSPAATRLIDAIVSGVGELSYPWRLRRNSAAQTEALKRFDEQLPREISADIDLDARSTARVSASHRRQQINRESIALRAIEDMRDVSTRPEAVEEEGSDIEADWVEYFWQKAETVSNEDMQNLWARVLTRKAVGHGISLRTLDLLRTLSVEEAKVIERLSKFRVAIGPDHRFLRNTVGLLVFPEFRFETDPSDAPERITIKGNQVVSKEDIPVDGRCRDLIGDPCAHILQPAGLYLNSSSSYGFALNWTNDPLPVQVGDSHFLLHGLQGGGEDGYSMVHFGYGIGFSQIGWEVFSFSKSAPCQEFLEIFQAKLEQRGLNLEHIARPQQ